MLRQERGENPVIWASIVLAREILLGKPITNAKIEKLLPSGKFDGTQRQYAADRAKTIAEHCKATQENYRERIDQAVQLAEVDVYWNKDVMREMYNSFRIKPRIHSARITDIIINNEESAVSFGGAAAQGDIKTTHQQNSPFVNITLGELLGLSQEESSKRIDSSFADNPIHQKKRELAVKLAKEMYKRLGKDFSPSLSAAGSFGKIEKKRGKIGRWRELVKIGQIGGG